MVCVIDININIKGKNPLYYNLKKFEESESQYLV